MHKPFVVSRQGSLPQSALVPLLPTLTTLALRLLAFLIQPFQLADVVLDRLKQRRNPFALSATQFHQFQVASDCSGQC